MTTTIRGRAESLAVASVDTGRLARDDAVGLTGIGRIGRIYRMCRMMISG